MTNWRFKLIFIFLLCFSFLILYRLYYLQIQKGEQYKALALGQQISFREVSGERGGIFFNEEKIPLAQTKRKNIIYVFPQKIPQEELEKTTLILGEILGEKKEDLLSFFKTGATLKREVSNPVLEQIEAKKLKGIVVDKIWGRVYPQKELASHLLGFLDTNGEGQYGIEGSYNKILQGEKEFEQKGKSPLGYLTLFFGERKSARKGADIFLTLNYKLQYFTEKLLLKAKESWDIDSGQIIVTDPKTGKILALAVFPSFDPNRYGEEKNYDTFLNPVFQKLFELGSVFKPITFAAALEENLITPQTTYIDEGFVAVGGPLIHNFGRRTWGKQSMTGVLERSINTGVVFVQQKLGPIMFLKYLKNFGLFEKTEIDLQGETFSENKTLIEESRPRDLAVASFGQGILITPIRLITIFGAIANHGDLMRPFVVEKIVKQDGEIIETQPQVQKKIISAETSATLSTMLVSVVDNGAAQRAKIPGYSIAGKTGTAQVPLKENRGYSDTETIQSFIGFFPALEPKFLIFIKLDNPKKTTDAGHSAVPLGKELIKYIIDSWQIPPDYEI
ncbi:penicillin-binding protein 2 [Patescibacteria group bacterium]|nr:penicillin-binding protein 2 [Patescibacteria group bacterium]